MSRQELNSPQEEQELTRREILQRGLAMSPLLLLPSTLAAACSPTRSTRAQADASPTDIPIAVRALMPQEMITATQEAGKPKQEASPSVNDIKIVKEFINPCQLYEGPSGESMWGGWLIKLESNEYYLKKGTFSLEKQTPSGVPIGGTVPLPNITLPAGAEFFIPAITESGRVYHTGTDSKLGRVKLKIDKTEWAKIDTSPSEHSLNVTLPQEHLSFEPRNPFRSDSPGGLKLTLNLENKGETVIQSVRGLAIVVDGNGNLLEILGAGTLGGLLRGGRPVYLPYGQKWSIDLLPWTYQNLGAQQPVTCALPISESAKVTYWVYFTTRTGMPVVHQDTI